MTTSATELEPAVQVFLAERTRLIRLASRIIGDRDRAEDVVQDAWVRWQQVDRSTITNPAAFLHTATTRLAINVIQSARHRHELTTEVPLTINPSVVPGPAGYAARALDVDRMLAFLMSKLTPSELTAYVLRKSFEYPYARIAAVMRTSVCNARQLVHRAQRSIGGDRSNPVDVGAHRLLVTAYRAATEAGSLAPLEELLTGGALAHAA